MGFWDSFIGPKVNSFLPSCVERNGITVSKTTRDAKEPAWGRLHIYTESLAFSENDLQTCEWNVSSILRKSKFCESRTVDVNVPCSTEWIWLTTSLSDEALGPELDSLISSRQYTIPDCETWMLGAHPIRSWIKPECPQISRQSAAVAFPEPTRLAKLYASQRSKGLAKKNCCIISRLGLGRKLEKTRPNLPDSPQFVYRQAIGRFLDA